MPKLVDHAQRRAEIAAVMWRVIARDGLPAASARTIAAEGGWSLGSVRHYFASQDELLLFAADAMMANVQQRLQHLLDTRPAGRARAQELLEQLLPLDDLRTAEVRAWLAVLIRSHVDPALAELRVAGWRGERWICRWAVAEIQGLGPPTGLEDALASGPERDAAALHLVVDGLTLQAASVPELVAPDDVRATLADHLVTLARR